MERSRPRCNPGNPTNRYRSCLLKITQSSDSAAQTTVSTRTHPHRFKGTPIACRVTPDEYKSMVLIANSCGMARMTEWPEEPAAPNDDGTPWHRGGLRAHDDRRSRQEAPGAQTECAAPDSRGPESARLLGRAWQVSRIVARVLGPAEAARGDDEHEGGRPHPPGRALVQQACGARGE